jgi:hypothetical protein
MRADDAEPYEAADGSRVRFWYFKDIGCGPGCSTGRYGWSPDWFLNEKPLRSGLPTAYPSQKFNSRLVAPIIL